MKDAKALVNIQIIRTMSKKVLRSAVQPIQKRETKLNFFTFTPQNYISQHQRRYTKLHTFFYCENSTRQEFQKIAFNQSMDI